MLVRFLIFALLVSVTAAFAMPDIPQKRALCSALLAAAVLGAAISISSSEATRLARRLRPLLILSAAVPAAFMALQLAPVPIRELGNPIWETASAALNAPLAERTTVDIRATVQALLHYDAAVALALITAVVALDRQRAGQVLSILVSLAAIVSAYLLLRRMREAVGLSDGDAPGLVMTGAAPAVLGLLLSGAMLARAFEERRRVKHVSLRLATTLSFALLAMLTCLATILVGGGGTSIAIAALLGTGIILATFVIRNWFYGIWGKAGVLSTAAVFFVAICTLLPMRPNVDLTVALSERNQAATERILQYTGPTGSGAGTYAALLPIHRDIGAPASQERPTAAAATAIEMGRPFLYGLMIITALGAAALLGRSLRRGYDYVYAAIGSGAAVSLTILAFVEDGILEFGTSLLAAAVFGLAVAQSQPNTGSATLQSRSSPSASGANGPDPTRLPARSYAFRNVAMRTGLGFVAVTLIAQTVWLLTRPPYLGDLRVEALAVSPASSQARPSALPNSRDGASDSRPGILAPATQPTANEAPVSRPEVEVHAAAFSAFAQALHYSPLRGDLWLMLAALSKEQKSNGYDIAALLKLSYYTAPNDVALLPLRLTVALGDASAVSDPELRELVQRDVKIAYASQPPLRPALIAAYQSASADGKTFVDNLISTWDPVPLQSKKELQAPSPGTDLPPQSKTPGRGPGRVNPKVFGQ